MKMKNGSEKLLRVREKCYSYFFDISHLFYKQYLYMHFEFETKIGEFVVMLFNIEYYFQINIYYFLFKNACLKRLLLAIENIIKIIAEYSQMWNFKTSKIGHNFD